MKAGVPKQRIYLGKHAMSRLPDESGVYFLYQSGSILVYIGKAISVRDRVLQHDKDKDKEFIRIGYELVHYPRARKLEQELLKLYREEHGQLPYYNRQC